MNRVKRTFNALMNDQFRYQQSEFSDLIYTGNWGPVVYPDTITASAWTVEDGSATLTNETFLSGGSTSVQISGSVGESTIVNKITTSSGQVEERIIKLKIKANDIPVINSDYGRGL